MENINEVLKYYVLSNKLKEEMSDSDKQLSVADNLFGSIILAISMDSEFKETKNLSKVLRILTLNEFEKINPNYDFNNLKQGKEFLDELDEIHTLKTKDAKTALKYKNLDFLLTHLIIKNRKRSYEKLLPEGVKILEFVNGNSSKNYEEIFKFFYLNFILKEKVRTGWDNTHWNVSAPKVENISDHIVGTISLALALQSEFNYDIDFDKVLKMLAIHETGETLIGDITPFDGITPEKKMEIEHKAMNSTLGNLKDKQELLELLFEFDKRETNEAIFCHYCDKIEADIQAKVYQDEGYQHPLNDQKNNCVFNSSKINEIISNGAKDAFDVWYEWDKNIYTKNNKFSSFTKLLELAKTNNLLDYRNTLSNNKEKVLTK